MKEDTQIDNKHIKIGSASLFIKVLEVKTTTRYHGILERLKFKRVSIPSAGKRVDNCTLTQH